MSKENILKEIIGGYRHLIHQRYQYQNIANKFEIPDSVDEHTVNKLRAYFLSFVYPEFSKREELNEAFESLDSYIKRPEKLLRMLLDSVKLFFTHGRQLPKILNAGLKALKSYRAATGFEEHLAKMAIKNDIHSPFDEQKINSLLKFLSREEIENFIETTESLILIFHDKKLVKEIKEVLAFLIKRMQEKKELYSVNEVKGLELGLAMLTEGDALFNQFNFNDQQQMIQLIIKVERSILDDVFKED